MDIIQSHYTDNIWKFGISCILLNQTTNKQVRPILNILFQKYKSPEDIINAKEEDIINIIRSAGLYNRRYDTIVKFSKEYIDKMGRSDIFNITDLYGMGRFAWESYEIFIKNNYSINPKDKVLSKYLKEKKP